MPRHRLLWSILAVAVGAGSAAHGQAPGKRAPAPAGPVIRYLSFAEGEIAPGVPIAVDGVLKLTMAGQQVRSADLDLCFPTSPLSTRVDRLVVPLRIQPGNVFMGSGPSLDGQATTVRLKRTTAPDGTALQGEVTRGDLRITLSGTGLEASVEDPAAPSQEADEPAPLTVPNEIEVTTGTAAIPDLLQFARTNRLIVRDAGLLPDCMAIRTGKAVVVLVTAPEKAADILRQLATVRGVQKAEMGASYDTGNVVRYRPAQAPAAADVAALIGRAGEASIPGLTLVSSATDAATGLITVALRRAPAPVAALGLEERVTLTALLGRDKEPGRFIVYFRSLDAKLVDPGTAGLIEATPPDGEEGGSSGASDIDATGALGAVIDGVARDSKGERLVDGKWVAGP